MQKLLFFFLAATLAVSANAQNSDKPIATLEQGDSTQVFEGENAFIDAYAAAASSGAVIRLSPGTFKPLTASVSKSFSLYGAGFENDSLTATNATYVSGKLVLVSCSDVYVEGIRFTGALAYGENYSSYTVENLTVKRCWFNGISSNYGTARVNFVNSSFLQCVIHGEIKGTGRTGTLADGDCGTANGLFFTNCWIGSGINGFNRASASLTLNHCFLAAQSTSVQYWSYAYNNCVFSMNSPIMLENSNGQVDHCVFAGSAPTLRATNCWENVDLKTFYADSTAAASTYTEGTDFSLAEPGQYVGSDDTQVGLYGGQFNWNRTTLPSIPRITSLKTTLDPVGGVLHVDMKAEAIQ